MRGWNGDVKKFMGWDEMVVAVVGEDGSETGWRWLGMETHLQG